MVAQRPPGGAEAPDLAGALPLVEAEAGPFPAGSETAERRCLKVAFIGTHGVGKTTLCFDLAAHLKRMDYRVDMVKEVARGCPLPLNRDTTVQAQAWILLTQMVREIEGEAEQDILVCDRSVLDNYAYMAVKFGRVEPYHALVADWLPRYALLAWVPVIESPRFDGVRDTDRTYQRRIDEVIEGLVTEFGISPLRLDPARRDHWTLDVIDALPLRSPQLPLFGGEPQ